MMAKFRCFYKKWSELIYNVHDVFQNEYMDFEIFSQCKDFLWDLAVLQKSGVMGQMKI